MSEKPPTPPGPERRTIVWLEPEQLPIVQAIGEAAGLRFIAAGTPARGRSAEIALALATTPLDDLRAGLAGAGFDKASGAELALIAAPPGVGTSASAQAEFERDALSACRERGVCVATLEPMPASILAFARPTAGAPEKTGEPVSAAAREAALGPAFVPRLRSSKRFRELADLLDDFGPACLVQIEALARRGEGSLGARLYDAIDAARWLLGDPETVHAACVPAAWAERTSLRNLPTDTLRGLHGTLSVNLQFGDGRAAHILASDAAARWSRSVTILGEGTHAEAGLLKAGDDSFQWVSADGTVLETGKAMRRRSAAVKSKAKMKRKPKPKAPPSSPHALFAHVAGSQLRELLAARQGPEPPIDTPRVMATAGAVLLSVRTGQAESVATVLRMMGLGEG